MSELNKKVWIYLLKDPRNGLPKYVGKSNNPKKRLKEHICDSKFEHTKKGNWIKKLIKLNLTPIIEILKETNESEFGFWECFFIKKLINEGIILLNFDEKGIGTASNPRKNSKKTKKKLSIKINQFDTSGNFIRQFNSLRDAEKLTKINHGNISKCCNGKRAHAGGYIFKKTIDKKPIIKLVFLNAIRKPVIELDSYGNTLAEYPSLMEASRKTKIDNGNMSKVCNGKMKKIKNRIFKFKN